MKPDDFEPILMFLLKYGIIGLCTVCSVVSLIGWAIGVLKPTMELMLLYSATIILWAFYWLLFLSPKD